MWSWNQFRNLPRNQGLDPREQARQYFIHQSNMMLEVASNNAVAAAAAAAAGAGGGKRKEEEFTQFPFLTTKARFFAFDFFDDPRFAPTPEELANHPNVPDEIVSYYYDKNDAAENLDTYYRAVREAFHQRQKDILSTQAFIAPLSSPLSSDPGPALPYLKGIDKYPIGWQNGELYTEPSFTYNNVYHKGPMALIEVIQSPLRFNNYNSKFKEPVATFEDLPLTGNELGDCRYVNEVYVWDGLEWTNRGDFANSDLEDKMTTFRARRETYYFTLNEVLASSKPFLWAAEYLPAYRLNKQTVFGFDLEDYVYFNIIGENESIVLTTENIEIMALTFKYTTAAFLKAVHEYKNAAYFLLTLEYRKTITELFNEFMTKMRGVCYIPDNYDFPDYQNITIEYGPYWDAMITGDKELTYQLRPNYVKNLKEAMAAVKKLIEHSSGGPIIYTME